MNSNFTQTQRRYSFILYSFIALHEKHILTHIYYTSLRTMTTIRLNRIIVLDSDSDESSQESSKEVEILSDSSCSLSTPTSKNRNQRKTRPPILLEDSSNSSSEEQNDHDNESDNDINNALQQLNIGIRRNQTNTKKQGRSQLDELHFSSDGSESENHDKVEYGTSSDDSYQSHRFEKKMTPMACTKPIFDLSSPSPCHSLLSPHDDGIDSIVKEADEMSDISSVEETAWCRNKNGDFIIRGTSYINQVENHKWPKYAIPKRLFDKLYDHQKVGVQWMASLHSKGIGGILGDDMGLGKTFQVLTLLAGLMRTKTIRNALIVCPVAVLKSWEREAIGILKQCCGLNITIRMMDSKIQKQRRAMMLEEALRCSEMRPHLMITTYGLVKSSTLDFLAGGKDSNCYWDYVICDEGHILKNHTTEQHKACARICRDDRTHRLLLTGTPVQNNMKELWALLNWATAGHIFGAQKTFMNTYAIPIEEGRNKMASDHTLRLAFKANEALKEKLKPHFLQRMKNQEFKSCLPDKVELVIWLRLSELQRQLYEKYVVDGGKVAAIISGEISSPLEAITHLKKLCDHPVLVDNEKVTADVETLRRDSPKLDVLVYLVTKLVKAGHRCLIFSPSTKILDIISLVLPVRLGRIDGSVDGKTRQSIVDRFNQEETHFDALLLSTKAAGVGLTLTGADRAIIFSPSWNPADDNQAVDRCFRIGQEKSVVVYRFVTGEGSVEERMYEKQVHKDGIRRTLMTSSGCATERHFSQSELRRMFELKGPGICEMFDKMKLNSDQSGPRSTLAKHKQVIGVASHDLIYVNSIVDLTKVEASPFSGTPIKFRSRSATELPSKTLTFEELAESVETPGNRFVSFSSGNDRQQTGVNDSSSSFEFCKAIEVVENLTKKGNITESLHYLFDILEENLTKADKMTVHKKIAARIKYLNLS